MGRKMKPFTNSRVTCENGIMTIEAENGFKKGFQLADIMPQILDAMEKKEREKIVKEAIDEFEYGGEIEFADARDLFKKYGFELATRNELEFLCENETPENIAKNLKSEMNEFDLQRLLKALQ